MDGRSTRHEGYAHSINARRGIEKVFGWIKAFGGLRPFKVRGQENVSAVHSFGEAFGYGLHVIAYNLISLGNLLKLLDVMAGAAGCPEVCPDGANQPHKR